MPQISKQTFSIIILATTLLLVQMTPLHYTVKLDPFETLAQTLRQQKHLDSNLQLEPEQYVEYNDYEGNDDYYENGQLPSREDFPPATVIWAPPMFQRGQRKWDAGIIPRVFPREEDEQDERYYQPSMIENGEKQRLLLDTFADYMLQFAAAKNEQPTAKRDQQQGQKEVSMGSQQKLPMSSKASFSVKSNSTESSNEHIKNNSKSQTTSGTSEDQLIGELNKLKSAKTDSN